MNDPKNLLGEARHEIARLRVALHELFAAADRLADYALSAHADQVTKRSSPSSLTTLSPCVRSARSTLVWYHATRSTATSDDGNSPDSTAPEAAVDSCGLSQEELALCKQLSVAPADFARTKAAPQIRRGPLRQHRQGLMRRAGHSSFSTTQVYIREAKPSTPKRSERCSLPCLSGSSEASTATICLTNWSKLEASSELPARNYNPIAVGGTGLEPATSGV